MKIYYDGASSSELEEVLKLGIISGVTTNLSFCKKEMNKTGQDYLDLLSKIQKIILKYNQKKLSYSVQATSIKPEAIVDEAVELYKNLSHDIDLKIKVPLCYENFKAIDKLIHKKIKVNATCVTSFLQGLAAANIGCSYVSFFWGKMTDEDIDPKRIISDLKNILIKNSLEKNCKILVGSIRQTKVIREAFVAGADIVTIQNDHFLKFLDQKKSDEANSLFQKDWGSK
jgi:TalC/MipB family fructose-6-phosphate aldolase